MNRVLTGRQPIIKIIKYMFLCIYSIAIIYPLLFVLMSSLKSNNEIFSTPFALPTVWNFKIYYDVWTKFNVQVYFLNSVYYATVSVAICVVISCMAAYGLTRMKWKLKGATFAFILLGLMVPMHSEVVPLYIGLNKLGFRDPKITLIGIFVAFAIPTTIFIVSGFIQSLPIELEESAVIEGCGLIKAFFLIIVPLLKPVIATVIIFNFLGVWNDFFAGLIFISQEGDKTLQLGISRFQGNFSTRYADLLAAIMITIIPSIIVYSVLQDQIISGLTAGAVKG
ncbi:MAG TPA: carbohydrate ABC transporter permease [Ruminiclostridium sp.]